MWLFPAGDLDSSTSVGYINSVAYNFFEPNRKVLGGQSNYNVLTAKMRDQLTHTYKLGNPLKKFTYGYENIFHREFIQLDAFTYLVGGALTSFFLPNLAMMEKYSGTLGSSNTITIKAPHLYSTDVNYKANYVFAWNGVSFMVGTITGTTSTSISFTQTYGITSILNPIVCPLYEVYMTEEAMDGFTASVFNDDTGTDGGWIWTGEINFISKYTV